ncbi:hypothetical protein HKD37_08G021006 [Glycine soja]
MVGGCSATFTLVRSVHWEFHQRKKEKRKSIGREKGRSPQNASVFYRRNWVLRLRFILWKQDLVSKSGVEQVEFELHHNPQNAIIADKTIQRATFPYRPSNSFHYIVG